ncbi:hypothetical protein EV401DRAFT_2079251 [Pisolithus croceorrhizus]|nr:hypothetical protein EV401DRAFT_2079251 [Pisolithus croceorrhizus]
MSCEAELPIPGVMLDDSQNTSHTPTPCHSCPPSTSRHSHNSSTCYHPETLQTVQGDDLFEDEEGMVPDPNVYQMEVCMAETIPMGSQPSDSESAVTADEGHQSSTSDIGQSSSQRTSTLCHTQDASEFSGRGGGSQTDYGAHHQDKCRYEEVDYSQALQCELPVNCLKSRITDFRPLLSIIQQWEEEQEVLRAQLEMKANMESQLQDLLKESHKTLNKALEQCDLELNERVNAVQATLMRRKPKLLIWNIGNHEPPEPPTRSHGYHGDIYDDKWVVHAHAHKITQTTYMSISTGCRTISMGHRTIGAKLRKKHRFSCKTRLIGVLLEEQNEGNSPRAPSIEQEPSVPPHDQLPNPQTSAFTDALTRGIETALRNVFTSGQFSQYTKQSPCKRRIQAKEVDEIRVIETQEEHNFYLEKVQLLFQEKFNFAHDMDFIVYEPADKDEVHAYEYEDGPGPNPEHLQFDLAKNSKSPWNSMRYAWRVAVLDHIVKLKTEGNEDDAGAWKWLQRLVKTLGEHGMSSDESDIGNDVEEVLRVKNMGWRHSIARELDLVDLQQLVDTDIFAPQGSRPMRRIRAPGNPESCRDAVKGLPLSLYDSAWVASLRQHQLDKLNTCEEQFSWMQIAVASI